MNASLPDPSKLNVRILVVLGLVALCLASAPAISAEQTPKTVTRARTHGGPAIAVFGAMRTPSRFLLIPTDLLTGRITFENAQLVSVIASMPLASFSLSLPGGSHRLDGFEVAAEMQMLRHFGLEDGWETTGAIVLRSGEIPLGRGASLNLAWGNGLSYAFTPPRLELGSGGLPGVDTPRLLWHMSAEAELSAASFPGYSGFMRIHHRSGIFGLLAPGWSGSNYLGVGLRYRYQR